MLSRKYWSSYGVMRLIVNSSYEIGQQGLVRLGYDMVIGNRGVILQITLEDEFLKV